MKLASDKQLTAEHLERSCVPVPIGQRLRDLGSRDSEIGLPAVVKPVDGAGSEQVRLIRDWSELAALGDRDRWRVERFVTGSPVSVSVLCGPGKFKLLPPTGQKFDREPFGTYVDSIYPLPATIADRATELARQTVEALPGTTGYIGIDMVIPDAIAGDDQPAVVIEVNPRITLSYVKLSQILGPGLATEMLEIATGR